MLVLVDWFSVDHLLARVDQGGPGQIIETGSSSYRLVHARNAPKAPGARPMSTDEAQRCADQGSSCLPPHLKQRPDGRHGAQVHSGWSRGSGGDTGWR